MNHTGMRSRCDVNGRTSIVLAVIFLAIGMVGCAPDFRPRFPRSPFRSQETDPPPGNSSDVTIPSEDSTATVPRTFRFSEQKRASENTRGIRVVKLPEQPRLPEEIIDSVPLPGPTEERDEGETGQESPSREGEPAPPSSPAEKPAESSASPTEEKPVGETGEESGGKEPMSEKSPDGEPDGEKSTETPPATSSLTATGTNTSMVRAEKPADAVKMADPVALVNTPDASVSESGIPAAMVRDPVSLAAFTSPTTEGGESEMDSLEVRNLSLVRQVLGYGRKTAFARPVFTASQAVILYAEIDRFETLRTTQGYYTAMRGTVTLRDASGRVVMRQSPELAEETCDSLRRDYYLAYILHLPSELTPGRYTLEFHVEDSCSGRTGGATLGVQVE
ncbi:MAG: hypothetical protein Q4C47_03280 [Planctomycetia bacterium]|nr:hypothetical protein [Planctomycetia bacterium]